MQKKTISKLLPIIIVTYSIMILFTFIFKDKIILIFADEKYLDNAWMLPFMLIATCVYTLSMMTTYEIFVHKQTKKLILSSILPGVASVTLGYYLIKNYYILGALGNFITTYSIYAVLTINATYRYRKLQTEISY